MALTIDELFVDKTLRQKAVSFEITFDSSYVTGGEPINLKQYGIGIKTLRGIQIEPTATYEFSYDRVNAKIQAWVRATGAQVAGSFDLSAVSTYVRAWGY